MKVTRRNPDQTHEVTGPKPVGELLAELEINPETVLVIHGGTLVTRDHVLPHEAEVEIRSVISGGAGPARCHGTREDGSRCRETAVIEIAWHNSAFCAACFVEHVRAQVRKAIDSHDMVSYDDTIVVAVSGGKDSLALWDVLLDMGYRVDGFYLGLGIGAYSDRSRAACEAFAAARGATLHVRDLAADFGFDVPTASRDDGRATCGVCGLSKRYAFNRVALEEGYDVMATGHNLDDEASQLLGNLLRWQTAFLSRQDVALPASQPAGNDAPTAGDGGDHSQDRGGSRRGLAKKVKPLYRLGERETAAYCLIKGIDYIVEECPLVAGNTVLRYKDALNGIEAHSPGTKAQFLFGFLDRARDAHFPAEASDAGAELVGCGECDMPTPRPSDGRPAVCAFCRTRRRMLRLVDDGPGTAGRRSA